MAAAAAAAPVDLGFVDDCDPLLLTSPYFPSKVGGKPAWLSWEGIPDAARLACPTCSKPMTFLLQVYTGGSWEHEEAFHRSVFLFVCRNNTCHPAGLNKGFRAIRCQLPKENKFYPSEPVEEGRVVHFTPPVAVCAVCQAGAEKKCSRCGARHYCCREHQALAWPTHKGSCKPGIEAWPPEPSPAHVLLSELELVIDEEQAPEAPRSEEERLRAYEEYVAATQVDTTEENLDEIEQDQKRDPIFLKFQSTIRSEPSQVLRYSKGGKPLWIGQAQPSEDSVPSCPHCHGPRVYEMQVMPQLLFHLKLDEAEDSSTLDFGVVAVYTCAASCNVVGAAYADEVVWHNPVTADP